MNIADEKKIMKPNEESGAFSVEERAIYGLLLRRSEESVILQRLQQIAPAELGEFAEKEDFRGRTLLVNAIHGHYEQIVKVLLVNLNIV